MTTDDQRAARAEALLQFEEVQERLRLLENKLHEIASDFEAWARILKERPETINFPAEEVEPIKAYKNLARLIEDVKETKAELQKLSRVTGKGLQ
jgi:DNA repair exonuclease SbcCD ATPase subunit